MKLRACFLCTLAVCAPSGACTSNEPARAEVVRASPQQASSATAQSVPRVPAADAFTIASYPGGYALVGNSATCTATMLGRGPTERWEYQVGECGGTLYVAVAPNSVGFARSATELVAFAPDGKRAWAASIGRLPAELSQPAVTLDSMVVAVASPNTVVAYRSDGTQAWTFKVDGEEKIVTSPKRSEAEGALVVTSAAVYTIAPDGQVRWRNTFAPPPK